MSFNYSFSKWFKLITQHYNDYNHAIFFGSLVPSWLWGDLMPWDKKQNPVETITYHTAYAKDSVGNLVRTFTYIKEVK